MSQYINFFLGESKDKLLCKLYSFSRSSIIYRNFGSALYGQVEELTTEWIDYFARECDEEKVGLERQLEKINEKIEQITHFDNSAEEKFRLISKFDEDKEEINDQLEEVNFGENFAFLLSELVVNTKQQGKFHIYYGIEVPF